MLRFSRRTAGEASLDPLSLPRADARGGLLRSYLELSKARLISLVIFTTLVGFLLAGGGSFDRALFLWTVLGTSLSAAGASALNQWLERARDALMERTRRRPLPTGAVGPLHAALFGTGLSIAGVGLLAWKVNLLTATLSLLVILIYTAVYTPLKTRSTLNTHVGAVCGAIPPMMGWTAATGGLDAGAWILGAILFVWQIPHFLSLAWLYREDYERGGFRMLPILDRTGRLTTRVLLLYSLALLPIALVTTLAGVTGWVYAVGSLALGLVGVGLGVGLVQSRSRASARRVFLGSILYLPLLLGLMIADHREPPRKGYGFAGSPPGLAGPGGSLKARAGSGVPSSPATAND